MRFSTEPDNFHCLRPRVGIIPFCVLLLCASVEVRGKVAEPFKTKGTGTELAVER